MPPCDRADVRDRLAAAVREAGALALQTFRGQLKSWTKGKSSPVSEADIAVDELLRERLLAIHDAGWLSEETEDDPARLQRAGLGGRSDRRHARPISRACRTGRSRRRWSRRAGRWSPRSMRRSTDELFLADRRQRRDAQRRADRGERGRSARGRASSRPKRRSRALAAIEPAFETHAAVPSLALRLARVANGALDGAFAGPDSHDWDLAAADLLVHEAGGLISTLTGQSLIYNRPDPVHGALLAAGRARHAVVAQPHARSACRIRVTRAAVGATRHEGWRHGRNRLTAGQLLHLVFGGELTDLDHVEFKDLDKLDIVGVYPNYATAYAAWKAKAQQTVDNAQMRYFIVHLHRLLDPETDQRAKR